MNGMGFVPLRPVWFVAVKSAEPDPRAEAHGALIKERRLDLGLNRPAFVSQMQKHGQEITPDYLNKLERGTAALARASLEVREAIRAVLGYSPEKWQELTGLYTPTPPPRPLTDAERRGWVLPEDDDEPEIPETLLIAAEKYGHGDNAPLAERRWLRELADLDFREEPETPEDWLAIYSRLAKLIDPKDN